VRILAFPRILAGGGVVAGAVPDGALFLPPAVVLVLLVLVLLLLWIEIVLQLQWGFHVRAADYSRAPFMHPTEGAL